MDIFIKYSPPLGNISDWIVFGLGLMKRLARAMERRKALCKRSKWVVDESYQGESGESRCIRSAVKPPWVASVENERKTNHARLATNAIVQR